VLVGNRGSALSHQSTQFVAAPITSALVFAPTEVFTRTPMPPVPMDRDVASVMALRATYKNDPGFLRGHFFRLAIVLRLVANLLPLEDHAAVWHDHSLCHEVTLTREWIGTPAPLGVVRRRGREGGAGCNQHCCSCHGDKEFTHDAPPFFGALLD